MMITQPTEMNPRITTGIPRLLIAVLVLLMTSQSVWADVGARLDRDRIYAGDTVTLTIEVEGRDSGSKPDLSALNADFTILGTGTSQQIRIINGERSEKRELRVELDPKHSGTLTIPPLTVGNSSTPALTLEVREQPAADDAAAAGQPVFLQTEMEPAETSPYVQQQVLLTTRLYYRVPLVEGSFDAPQPENAVIERLGEDSQYQTTVNDQHYQVIERHYALFPQQSGTLSIPPVTFTGRVISPSSRRTSGSRVNTMMERFFGGNPFDDSFFSSTPFGDPGKRIRVRSQPLTLEVQTRPDGYSGRHWLPGEQLTLRDSWMQGPPEFRVGEPVTRTIRIEARGLEAAQLPVIEVSKIPGMRLYPEPPVRQNRTDGSGVFGYSEQSIAYVPSQPGKLTLPEIRIDWWDTASSQQQTAVLPAWEINVLPGDGSTATAPPPAPAEPVWQDPGTDNGAAAPETGTPSRQTRLETWWPWIAVGGSALLILALLLIWLLRRGHPGQIAAVGQAVTGKPNTARTPRGGEARQALERACELNDAQAAARSLLEWAAAIWPEAPPRSLGALGQRLATGTAEVHALEQALYAPGHETWQGQSLWEALQTGLREPVPGPSPAGDGLLPLYPRWEHKSL